MTPAARIQTAIELLEPIFEGAPAERVLTQWARKSRFAGSKDRAAVRDHVYDALRQRNTAAQTGGGDDARSVMLGLLRLQGIDAEPLFTGTAYGPAALTASEKTYGTTDGTPDLPDWIVPEFQNALGANFPAVEQALKTRAPVILRVNLRKATTGKAKAMLADEGIITAAHPASETALQVTEGARKVKISAAYKDGLIELQDAASQAAIDLLPLDQVQSVLDYCAGGGGKLLAMAGKSNAKFYAHDAIQTRLRDLPNRAKRAGVPVTVCDGATLTKNGPYDLVFCDVPCSGTGTWRRDPDAKWKFTREALVELLGLQQEILREASARVSPGGYLAYATCSFLRSENEDQIAAFAKEAPGFKHIHSQRWTPLDGCDGFFTALFQRQ